MNTNRWYLVYLALNSYEHTVHYYKMVQRLQKQGGSQKFIAHSYYQSLLNMWCNAEYKHYRWVWVKSIYDYAIYPKDKAERERF